LATPEQLIAVHREYARIGKDRHALWPEPKRDLTTDEFIDLLKRVPTSSGLRGYMTLLDEEEGGWPIPPL
jgi:hypothetical protein